MFDVIAAQIDVRIAPAQSPEARAMPTKSRPAALPLFSRQGPSLRIRKEWIDGGIFFVVAIHRIEFFANTGKSLAIDICSHGIRIELTTRPAPPFSKSVSLFEEGIRNRDRGFHEVSITAHLQISID